MSTGIAMRALGDAPHCGDLCAYWSDGSKITLCIADGLGHGKEAAAAAAAAVGYVGDHRQEPLQAVFEGCNKAIAGTRGVAMGIAVMDLPDGRLSYSAIGNTRGMVYGKKNTWLNGDYGIVGAGYRRLAPEDHVVDPDALVVLWTDGIPEALDLSGCGPDILADPQLLAEHLVADRALGTDDAAVLVFRVPRRP